MWMGHSGKTSFAVIDAEHIRASGDRCTWSYSIWFSRSSNGLDVRGSYPCYSSRLNLQHATCNVVEGNIQKRISKLSRLCLQFYLPSKSVSNEDLNLESSSVFRARSCIYWHRLPIGSWLINFYKSVKWYAKPLNSFS